MRWSNLSIRYKLALGLGSLVILALFINVRFGRALSKNQDAYTNLINGPIKLATLMEDTSALLNEMRAKEKEFLITQNVEHATLFREDSQKIHKDLQEALAIQSMLTKNNSSVNFENRIKAIDGQLKNYASKFEELKSGWENKGLDHNSGLRGEMRAAVHRTEEIFKKVNEAPLMVELLMLRRHEKDYLLRGLEKYPQKWSDTKAKLEGMVARVNLKASARQEVSESLNAYDAAFKALQDQDKVINQIREELAGIIAEVQPTLESVRLDALDYSKNQQEATLAIANERKSNLYIFATIVGVLFIICGFAITRGITKPLKSLMVSINALEEGNLESLPQSQSTDEIGRVSMALRRVMEAIRDTFSTTHLNWTELAEQQQREKERIENERHEKRLLEEKVAHTQDVLQAAASGDLSKNIDLNGEDAMGRVGAHLRALLGTLSDDLGQIGQQSTVIKSASSALHQVSDDINTQVDSTNAHILSTNSRVSEVNSSLQNVATAIEEMNACISEIARSAESAEGIAETAVKEAQTSAEIISKLKRHGDEISQMADEIGRVAQQTNLLSLNASIEAERAGESGRGFRVVASEVKELAHTTGITTDKIRNNVSAIQAAMGSAVGSVERINEVVNNIFDIQRSIASSVEEQSVTANEIMSLITQSATDSNEIANLMAQVQQNSEETGSCVDKANQVIGQLGTLSDSLNTMMSKFKVSA